MMDLYGSEAIETTSIKPNNYPCYNKILKKALHFLVPLSLLILSSYNFHFSHALERKYMFLICNGILFFLAKTLTFPSSFSVTTDLDFTCLPPINVQSPPPETLIGLDDDVASKNDDALLQEEEEEEEEKKEIFSSRHGGALKVAVIEEADDEKGEGEEGGAGLVGVLQTDEEEEEEEEDNDMNINTEELNRRVEEFIRKMKEEIRIEAKQHLIAV